MTALEARRIFFVGLSTCKFYFFIFFGSAFRKETSCSSLRSDITGFPILSSLRRQQFSAAGHHYYFTEESTTTNPSAILRMTASVCFYRPLLSCICPGHLFGFCFLFDSGLVFFAKFCVSSMRFSNSLLVSAIFLGDLFTLLGVNQIRNFIKNFFI